MKKATFGAGCFWGVEAAFRSKEAEQASHAKPIVTRIEPAQTLYEAEDYHQQYLEKRGRATCAPALRL